MSIILDSSILARIVTDARSQSGSQQRSTYIRSCQLGRSIPFSSYSIRTFIRFPISHSFHLNIIIIIMKYSGIAASATALMAGLASAASSVTGVVGTPEGFASGATGGGKATPVYPTSTDELVSYLGDSSPRVIVLTKT